MSCKCEYFQKFSPVESFASTSALHFLPYVIIIIKISLLCTAQLFANRIARHPRVIYYCTCHIFLLWFSCAASKPIITIVVNPSKRCQNRREQTYNMQFNVSFSPRCIIVVLYWSIASQNEIKWVERRWSSFPTLRTYVAVRRTRINRIKSLRILNGTHAHQEYITAFSRNTLSMLDKMKKKKNDLNESINQFPARHANVSMINTIIIIINGLGRQWWQRATRVYGDTIYNTATD